MFFGAMDPQGEGCSVLKPLQMLINKVQNPILSVNRNMGELSKTQHGKLAYRRFLDQIELFDGYLQSIVSCTSNLCAFHKTICRLGAEQCSSQILELPQASVDISKLDDARDCIEVSKDPDFVASLEVTVTDWCKRIEVVRSDQWFTCRKLPKFSVITKLNSCEKW